MQDSLFLNPPTKLTLIDTASLYHYRRKIMAGRQVNYRKLREIIENERKAIGWDPGETHGIAAIDTNNPGVSSIENRLIEAGVNAVPVHYKYTQREGKPGEGHGSQTVALTSCIAWLCGRLAGQKDVELMIITHAFGPWMYAVDFLKDVYGAKIGFAYDSSILDQQWLATNDPDVVLVNLNDYHKEIFFFPQRQRQTVGA